MTSGAAHVREALFGSNIALNEINRQLLPELSGGVKPGSKSPTAGGRSPGMSRSKLSQTREAIISKLLPIEAVSPGSTGLFGNATQSPFARDSSGNFINRGTPRRTSPTAGGRTPGAARTKLSQMIKSASLKVKEAQSRYKTAEEHGTMSPDEAKEVSAEIVDMALSIADAASMIEEEVPAEENLNDVTDMLGGEPEIPIGPETFETSELSEISPEATDDPEELKQQVAQMQRELTAMKVAQQKTKLAQRYAQIFTEPQREAKYTEFMNRTAPVGILQAQVVEAESLLSGPRPVIKQAQLGDDTFSLFDFETPQDETVSLGGRV